jgi:hypothetical protein
MDGDNNNLLMRLYGISLTRNGAIENNSFMASINPANVGEMHWTFDPLNGDPIGNDGPRVPEDPFLPSSTYITAYPVPIPTTTGGWFENVTQAKIDSTGLLPLDTSIDSQSPYIYYDGDLEENVVDYELVNKFGPYVPELKYGFDPLWNVGDDTEYTWIGKNGDEYDYGSGTFLGTPKPLSIVDVPWFKQKTCLGKRLIAVYNDSDTALTNVKVRISDQTLKGAVTEITQYVNAADDWYYRRDDIGFSLEEVSIASMAYSDLVRTDGVDYRPEYVKFWLADANYLGLDNSTMNVLEEITIDYLGPAGTRDAWAFGVLSQYVTVENGNYAGVEDDYMVLSTETNAY